MCSLAFYAFLRIGEITSVSKQGAPSPLQYYQLTKLLNAAGELTAFKVTFGKFKHSYNERPFSVVVSRHSHSCPVDLLSKYLALGGSGPGPISITVDGWPVSRSKFSQHLSIAIQLCGLPVIRDVVSVLGRPLMQQSGVCLMLKSVL